MADLQRNKDSKTISSSPVTVYENLLAANHEGYIFFQNFASGDVFNYTVEVIDMWDSTYKVVTNKNVDYPTLQNFVEKGIHIYPRTTDQIRIKMTKVSGLDRAVNINMYALLL